MTTRKRADAIEQGQTSALFRDPPGIIHVPEVPELAEQGLATIVAYTDKGVPTHYRVKPDGQQVIDAAMKHNAEIRREAHDHLE